MLEKNGTLFNKDKTKKLDYTKLSSRYDIVISELKEKKENGNITKRSYIRLNNYNFTMNEKALLNYLYAEGYTDQKGQ